MNSKSCCTRETCPRNQIANMNQDSSQQSSEKEEYFDKETQKSVEDLEYREYGHCRSKGIKDRISVDMSKVYECMEDADIFRGCLLQLAILSEDLFGYLKRDSKGKTKYKKHRQRFKLKPVNFEIPLDIHLPKIKKKERNCDQGPKEQPMKPVTNEEDDMFYSCESLTEIEIQNSLPPNCSQFSPKSEETFLCQCKLGWKKAFCKISQSEGALCNTEHPCRLQGTNSLGSLRGRQNEKSFESQTTFKHTIDYDASCSTSNKEIENALDIQAPLNPNKDKISKAMGVIIPEICNCGREKLQFEDLQTEQHSKVSFCQREKKCACDLNDHIFAKSKEAIKSKPPKLYRMALPQHKDVEVCIKCRFDPSPLVDEDGTVFCPGNCGCCLCAWTPRATASLEDVLKHSKLKVCKCRNRGTIFEDFDEIQSICSQISYFDICPCREKVEAKHLELYGFEMWQVNGRLLHHPRRGEEVPLLEVRELKPDRPGSTRFLSSRMFNEI